MNKLIKLINKADDKLMDFINKLDLKCCICIFLCSFFSVLFSGFMKKYNVDFVDKIFILLSVLFFSNCYEEFIKQIKRKH